MDVIDGFIWTPVRRFQAENCFAESLALCPDYPDAIKWKEKLANVKVKGSPYFLFFGHFVWVKVTLSLERIILRPSPRRAW